MYQVFIFIYSDRSAGDRIVKVFLGFNNSHLKVTNGMKKKVAQLMYRML